MSLERVLQANKRIRSDALNVEQTAQHVAIRPVPDRRRPSDVHETREHNSHSLVASDFGHDFSRVPAHASGPAANQTSACALSPRSCPFGGTCHTCPAPVQSS
jgi:hypothetical protein